MVVLILLKHSHNHLQIKTNPRVSLFFPSSTWLFSMHELVQFKIAYKVWNWPHILLYKILCLTTYSLIGKSGVTLVIRNDRQLKWSIFSKTKQCGCRRWKEQKWSSRNSSLKFMWNPQPKTPFSIIPNLKWFPLQLASLITKNCKLTTYATYPLALLSMSHFVEFVSNQLYKAIIFWSVLVFVKIISSLST